MIYTVFSCMMPPSVNQSLASIRGRLIKTSVARQFRIKALDQLTADPDFKIAREKLKEYVKDRMGLRVDAFFIWPEKDVFTATPKAKNWAHKRDASNRIKQLHDVLAEALEIDDLYFFAGDTVKAYHPDNSISPYCIIKIQPTVPCSLAEVWRKIHDGRQG